MSSLRAACESLGYRDVRTYLQSGNVVFQAARASGEAIARAIRDAAEVDATVILRTAGDLRGIVERNPFPGLEPTRLVVVFLEREPPGSLDYNGPEPFHLSGRELYVDYLNGQGRSKLNNTFIEKKLGLRATARNWNTVTALAAMTS